MVWCWLLNSVLNLYYSHVIANCTVGYRARLTMPKLLIVAAADQFFLLQDSHYFLENMSAPMYML
jgi:PhoPQ-activated pathogenicity-related protein